MAAVGFIEKKVLSIVNTLVSKPVFSILTGAFSAFVMTGYNYLVRRYPEEAKNIAARISNIYFDASSSWILFARDYMENMTGKQIDPAIIDKLIGSKINLTGKVMAEEIGKEFLTPMLGMIMPGTPDWNKIRKDANLPKSAQYAQLKNLNPSDGLLGAERFLGVNLQFQLQAWMLHFIGDTVSMGSMKSLKDLPNAISWSYGIGWLSWLVMGTPFRVAIAEPLEKLLNMLYRPKDLPPAQMIKAYRQGKVTNEELWRVMREAGFTDELIGIQIEQDTEKLPVSVLKDLLLTKRKDEKIIREELKASGFNLARIDAMLDSWKRERQDKILNRWAEECIDAYEKRVIDEPTLRKALKTAGWEDVETENSINLQILTSDLVRSQSGMFTKAEIRALYTDHLIPLSRALSELKRFGITDDDAHLLILYWSGKKASAGVPVELLWSQLLEWFEG